MKKNNVYITSAVRTAVASLGKSLKNVPADEVQQVRQDGLDYAENVNAWFENAFQLRMKQGARFKFLDIQAFVPQVIGEETDLIKVD